MISFESKNLLSNDYYKDGSDSFFYIKNRIKSNIFKKDYVYILECFKLLNIMGYNVHFCERYADFPEGFREFDNCLHESNDLYIHNDCEILPNTLHELGHALLADREQALGRNWQPRAFGYSYTNYSDNFCEACAVMFSFIVADKLTANNDEIAHQMYSILDRFAGGYVDYLYFKGKEQGQNLFHDRVNFVFESLKMNIIHEFPIAWKLGEDCYDHIDCNDKNENFFMIKKSTLPKTKREQNYE